MASHHRRSLGVLCLLVVVATALPAVAAEPFFDGLPPPVQGQKSALATPGGTNCGGISNTTGHPSNGYMAGVPLTIFVQRFTPSSYPATITDVCIAGYADGVAEAPYDVVIFSDVNGMPGTLLATVTAAPAIAGVFPGTWMTTSVAGVVPPLTGPFWAGPRINGAPRFAMDFEPVDFPVGQMLSGDDGATFFPYTNPGVSANIQVVGPSGAMFGAIPTLSGLGLAALVAALAAGGFLVLRQT